MAYRIRGLPAAPFTALFTADAATLAARRARMLIADDCTGFPCRVSLVEARVGEQVVLVNHVHQPADGPFHASHAIYVRRDVRPPEPYIDCLPEMLDRRQLSLRGFDGDGMLAGAAVAAPGEADRVIRTLIADSRIAVIHAHNAAYGCYLAGVERHSGDRT